MPNSTPEITDAQALRAWIDAEGGSVEHFAKTIVECDKSTVYKWLRGENQPHPRIRRRLDPYRALVALATKG